MADRKASADKAKTAGKARAVKAPAGAPSGAPAAAKPAVAAKAAAAPVAKAAPAKPQPAQAAKPVTPPLAAPAKPAAALRPADNIAAPAAKAPESAAPTVKAPESAAKVTQSNVNILQSGAKSMTETFTNTVNQAQQTAQQTAQQASEQFRGAIDEANERGKLAMEKSARIIEEMADLGRGNMEAFVASSKTAAKYMETLTQGAADFNRRRFEEASATLRSFAEVKSPTDFFRVQSDFARKQFDSLVAESARVSETVVKMSGDVAEPITSRYTVAAERLKTVAA